MRPGLAHRGIWGRRFEPSARQHFMPELEVTCRASSLETSRRPYAVAFTAKAPRPFLIVTTAVGRRGSKGLFSAADRLQDADPLFAFMPYNG